MLLDLLLIILLLGAIGGFGYGWRVGDLTPASPLGLFLLVLVILLIAALIWPHVPLYRPVAPQP